MSALKRTSFVTSCFSAHQTLSEDGPCSKRKEFASKGRKLFSFRADSFCRRGKRHIPERVSIPLTLKLLGVSFVICLWFWKSNSVWTQIRLYAKIGLNSMQEYSADNINRWYFQMQVFLTFQGLSLYMKAAYFWQECFGTVIFFASRNF